MAKFVIPEFKPCDKFGHCPYPEGCKYPSALGKYRNSEGLYKDCHYRKEYNRKTNILIYCKNNGLLSKKDYTFANYAGTSSITSVKKMMDIAYNPDEYLGTNFYIFGPNGTQKTTMVKAMCRRIAEVYCPVKKSVIFTSMSILANALNDEREQYFRDDLNEFSESIYQLNRYRNADILVLDESFDMEKMKAYKSKWNLDLLDSFIRTRMDDGDKSTFYISNVNPEMIDVELFGPSIRDLIDRDTEKLMFLDRYDSTIPVRQAVVK